MDACYLTGVRDGLQCDVDSGGSLCGLRGERQGRGSDADCGSGVCCVLCAVCCVLCAVCCVLCAAQRRGAEEVTSFLA